MEKLIKTVAEKSKISEAQAKTAIETVVGFLKDKMPAGIGGQVESFIKGSKSSLGDIAAGMKEKISEKFGK